MIQLAYFLSLNSHLGRLDNVLNEDDGLEGGEQSVDTCAGVLDCARQLGLGDPDVNVQECLVGKSSNESYIQSCENLYIFATAIKAAFADAPKGPKTIHKDGNQSKTS